MLNELHTDDDDEFDYLPLPELSENSVDPNSIGVSSYISFSSIYEPPLPFSSLSRKCFLPKQHLDVEIFKCEQDHTNLFNPNIYFIKITHGNYQWILRRRYKHFRELHDSLVLFKTKNIMLPMISQEAKEIKKSFSGGNAVRISRFPKRPDAMVRSDESVEERRVALETYLQSVLSFSSFRDHPETLAFLEVSKLSFINSLGPKLKEGMVKKKAGGRRVSLKCCSCCQMFQPSHWLKRWLLLKDTFIAYIRPEDGVISDVMLMDQEFDCSWGVLTTGHRHGLKITNLSRYLTLRCWTSIKAEEWFNEILKASKDTAKDYTQKNRYASFAPVRPNSYCNWYVDGGSYMAAVADALETACEEIFITDWMLSPQLYLKRPQIDGEKWRLDEMLIRKAKQGVKVFIMLYKEVVTALGISSYYAKQCLSKHPNIKVLRHPDGIKLWTHHDKCVVIDQRIAFLGGIDLCYGRWDTRKHRLTDLGSRNLANIYGEEDKETLDNILKKKSNILPKLESIIESQENISNTMILKNNEMDIKTCFENPINVREESPIRTRPHIGPSNIESKIDTRSVAVLEELSNEVKPNDVHLSVTSKLHRGSICSEEVLLKERPRMMIESFNKLLTDIEEDSKEEPKESPLKTQVQLDQAFIQESKDDKDLEEAYKAYIDEIQTEGNKSSKSQSMDENMNQGVSGSWSKRWRKIKGFAAIKEDGQSDSIENLKPLPSSKETTPKQIRKTKISLKSLAQLKIMFHRESSQNVDVADDIDRTWNESIYNAKIKDGTEYDLNESIAKLNEEEKNSLKIWIGKDYVNFIFKSFVQLDQPFTDFIDRSTTPRMPWHDIGAVVFGKPARDVARHFIERWNFTKLQKAKKNLNIPMILPKSNACVNIPKWISRNAFTCDSQILRSSCEWASGIKKTEMSIHNGYCDLIRNAKYYVYIENQFFVTISNNTVVENKIADALYDRIILAFNNKELFRVYVILPLLPGFEGELGTSSDTSIKMIIHWNYKSICRGGQSLIERLLKIIPDPFEYITFYGLRKHEEMLGKLTTELVYVHSKLMIVDDEKVIIGSANINDRSMLGTRDSEIAIVTEDKKFVDSYMGGQEFKAGAFASSLRKSLFREHLGLDINDDEIDVSDPICKNFYKDIWIKQASINTNIFDIVFRCLPVDTVHTIEELHIYQKEPIMALENPAEAKKFLQKVKGHLVLMPLQFLSDCNLGAQLGSKEALLPDVVWT